MKYQLEINYFLYLLKCAVADIVPKPAEKEINWEVVYKFAKLHKVTSTLYFSISKLQSLRIRENRKNFSRK